MNKKENTLHTESVNGTLDLSDWNFEAEPVYTLKGEWIFYWQQFPYDSLGNFNLKALNDSSRISIKARETWKQAGYPRKGFGTYRMKIKLPASSEAYGFKTFRLKSACEVWINGTKVADLGKIGDTPLESIPDGRPLFFELPKEGIIDLVMPVSNFSDGRGGGTSHSIQIASYPILQRARVLKIIESAIGMAIALTMAIFQGILFVFKKRKESLYIALFCLAVLIRIVCIDEVILYYLAPELPLWLLQKARYFSFYCFVVLLVLYYRELLPDYFKKWFVQIAVYAFSFGAVYVIIVPSYWATITGFVFNILTLLGSIYVFYVLVRLLFSQQAVHKLIFFSLLFIFFIGVNDTLHVRGVIDTGDAGMWSVGLLFYLGIQTIIGYKLQEEIEGQNHVMEVLVDQKEMMLKEVHHRVKNNFQIVSSLLEMQSKGIKDEKALQLANDGQNRLKSMAFIHQKLYQSNTGLIDFKEYLNKLIQEISEMYQSKKLVELNIESQNIELDIDTAIPLGLIANEIITNSYKHAFKNITNPTLDVHVRMLETNEYVMTISDNGIGIDKSIDVQKQKSMGLRLIRGLVKQLNGSMEVSGENGTNFQINFQDTAARRLVE